MRLLILTILIQLTTLAALKAQQISGVVKDEKSVPLSGATVSLLQAADSSVLKLEVSKENGAFTFSGIERGQYLLSAGLVGHSTVFSSLITLGEEPMVVADLVLVPASKDLKAVVVSARKPMIELKADKMVVNVEGTVNAIGNNVLELLRKSPGVTLDKDEKLALSGKNGVQVYIDGRPSPLSGDDLTAYLRSIQSAGVEAIEIITNPSAKYDAAGNAGIINIRLKKNKAYGTNGSVNAGFNMGTYAKYNTGISFNHRNKKVNLFGNYNFNRATTRKDIAMHRSLLDSSFRQQGRVVEKGFAHNFKSGVDYFINTKSTVGLVVNGNFSDPTVANNSYTPITYIPSGNVSRILVADNELLSARSHIDLNLNYSYSGSNGRLLNLNADYGYYDMSSDQLQPNYYYDASGLTLLHKAVYQMLAPTAIDIYAVKGDYEQALGKGKLGAGAKVSYVATDNDFQHYTVEGPSKRLNIDRSNRFIYKERISAGYINYHRSFNKVLVQGGLRMEHVDLKGTSMGLQERNGVKEPYSSSLKRNYMDFFPSVSMTFTQWKDGQVSLSYSRRIDRPAYQDLNPFVFNVDEYLMQKGNTALRPQYTSSFGLSHTYKQKLTTTLNYSRVRDLSTWLLDTTERSKAIVSKQNLANQRVVSASVSYPFQYKSYSLFTNVNTAYSTFAADYGSGRSIEESALSFNFFAQNNLKFGKGWVAELTGFYNAPTVHEGNMKVRSMWSMEAGLQKSVLGTKGQLKVSVSDFLGTLQFRSTSVFAGQTAIYNTKWESRQAKLSFVYRFGNSEVKSARQRKSGAEEEMKRVQ